VVILDLIPMYGSRKSGTYPRSEKPKVPSQKGVACHALPMKAEQDDKKKRLNQDNNIFLEAKAKSNPGEGR